MEGLNIHNTAHWITFKLLLLSYFTFRVYQHEPKFFRVRVCFAVALFQASEKAS
jgi:hypothetical protein